jgi:hypothetical protein
MGLIVLGLWGIATWWDAFSFAMRAFVPLAALLCGTLAVLSSYSRLGFAAPRGGDEEEE